MHFLTSIKTLAAAMILAAVPAAAQSHSYGWFQPSMAQIETDLSNLENNLHLAAQWRGGVYLGVRLADIDSDRAKALHLNEERGAEVVKVEPGSPAESAGLKAGDVLLSYNGENILGAQQLGRLVSETPKGRKVKIQFWRDGKMQGAVAVLAESPGPRAFPADLDLQIPEVRMVVPEIPSPMVVWKSSALGIECEPLDSQLGEYFGVKRGVLVRSVEKGSAGDKAGLRAGDVLTAVNDRPVASAHDVVSCVRTQRRAGKPIAVALVREHKELTLSVLPDSDNQE
jgi:serine protease Do